jgi:hypothetical protein
MIELNAFLLWLICVGISAIAIGYFIKYYNNSPNEGFVVYSCPSNTTKYINNDGETNCCNGQIVDGRCTGNNVCSLSPTNTLKLPSCGDYTISLLRNAEKEYCFPEMPHYFASANGSLRGCSASVILPDGTAPADPGQLQCILYSTPALDKIKLDSCYNYNLNKNKPAVANCPVPQATLPSSYIPKQNTVLMKTFAMTEDYELDFDITPTGVPVGQWTNIIHFTSNNTDSGGFGARSPAFWFNPGTHNLHVRFGDSNDMNYGFDSQAGCTQGNQSHVNLRCKGKKVVLTIDSNIYTMTQPTKRYSGPVIVYGSSPWFPQASCKIENLRIRTF